MQELLTAELKALIDSFHFPQISVVLGVAFLSVVLSVMLGNTIMFTRRHGRRHALNGLIYFVWISVGFYLYLTESNYVSNFVFDVVLGLLGTFLPLSAAYDFGHKNIVNNASGTLDEHATVTYNEMIEHSFYQALNLVQVVYLRLITPDSTELYRGLLLFGATAPWFLRSKFPVHSFSDNYNKIDAKSTAFIRTMYRIKKYQYVFYKHFLLHGLNLSASVYGYSLVDRKDFRLYWLLLNLSYVMEFFLQTLVKKKYMQQRTMLMLQVVLMSASTIAAVYVLQHVGILLAAASLLLNFINRGNDILNTMLVFFCFQMNVH